MPGNVEADDVAAMTSMRVSVVSGGVLCIAGTAVLAVVLQKFFLYDADAVERIDEQVR